MMGRFLPGVGLSRRGGTMLGTHGRAAHRSSGGADLVRPGVDLASLPPDLPPPSLYDMHRRCCRAMDGTR